MENLPRVKILVVDDNPDNRFLVSKTLLRKFPAAVILDCEALEPAIRFVRAGVGLIIAHRTLEADGPELLRRLREVDASVPIIAISAMDKRKGMVAAGATRFHLIDEWLLIGTAAEELLKSARPQHGAPKPASPHAPSNPGPR